jgi:signal transduction histidine kinase
MPAPKPPTSILVVDDDEGVLILMAETLRSQGYEVTTAVSVQTARDAVASVEPDLMVLDLKLKDGGGPGMIAALQPGDRRVPFIVVTGQGDEKVAVEMMKQGALDYVIKDTRLLDVLPAVVQRALAAVAQEHALARAQEEHKRLEHEILAAGERERQSIGADLHDNLGQLLTALELMCATAKEDTTALPSVAKRLDQMGRMLREAIAQTRFLARGLVPVGDEPEALQTGLESLADRTAALGHVTCRLECPQPVLVHDSAVAGHLYRIAQEAVNNAIKHARARHVTLRLRRGEGALLLEVEDDGAGLKSTRTARGLGLSIMQHRAATIGAELTIDSRRGAGVTIRCRLPQTQ